MKSYLVMMKDEDGTVEQYGRYADRRWAQVELEKVRKWYWMYYETFYIEEA